MDQSEVGRITQVPEAEKLHVPEPDSPVLAEAGMLFKVLGDMTRMRLLAILLQRTCCVHELTELLDMNQSAVSHQLRILRQARLVSFRKDGKHAWYSLADDHVRQMLALALDHVTEQPVRPSGYEETQDFDWLES